jgi:hypothetical protein
VVVVEWLGISSSRLKFSATESLAFSAPPTLPTSFKAFHQSLITVYLSILAVMLYNHVKYITLWLYFLDFASASQGTLSEKSAVLLPLIIPECT